MNGCITQGIQVPGYRGQSKKLLESPKTDREEKRVRHIDKYKCRHKKKKSKNGTCLMERHQLVPETGTVELDVWPVRMFSRVRAIWHYLSTQ